VRKRRLEIRLGDEELSIEVAAAAAAGETLSDFVRRAARARAEEVPAEQQTVVLTDAEATRFLDALESPEAGSVARLRELRDRA